MTPCQGRGPLEGQAGGDTPTLPGVCGIVVPLIKTALSFPLLSLERS